MMPGHAVGFLWDCCGILNNNMRHMQAAHVAGSSLGTCYNAVTYFILIRELPVSHLRTAVTALAA